MNGDYKVTPEDWKKQTTSQKLWFIYNTFNSYRENTDSRFRKHKQAIIIIAVVLLVQVAPELPAWALKIIALF